MTSRDVLELYMTGYLSSTFGSSGYGVRCSVSMKGKTTTDGNVYMLNCELLPFVKA